MVQLIAIILTKNEEADLPGCLRSLEGTADSIIVVDSGSTDNTVEVALSFGAQVLRHEFSNYSSQFNWALAQLESHGDAWVLRIDADERVTPRLKESLNALKSSDTENVRGYLLPLRVKFLGRTMRYGGTYPVWLLRVFRRDCGRCEATEMDEHIVLSGGVVERLQGDLLHEIPKSLSQWSNKHVWYAARECVDIDRGVHSKLETPTGPAGVKRRAKGLYLRLPLFIRPALYFVYRYVFRLGCLDGKEGLIYHLLQGFWYRALVDALLFERSHVAAGVKSERV